MGDAPSVPVESPRGDPLLSPELKDLEGKEVTAPACWRPIPTPGISRDNVASACCMFSLSPWERDLSGSPALEEFGHPQPLESLEISSSGGEV